MERATTKMLDRWSVLTYDGPPIVSGSDMPTNDEAELNNYLDTILDNQNPEKVHKAVDGLYELSKKVQISRLSKFLDLIQKAGWTNNADVNQVRYSQGATWTFFSMYCKCSSDQSHFIFEINVGKSRIRHRTTPNLNHTIYNPF